MTSQKKNWIFGRTSLFTFFCHGDVAWGRIYKDHSSRFLFRFFPKWAGIKGVFVLDFTVWHFWKSHYLYPSEYIVAFYWLLIIREVIINCLQFSYHTYGTVNKTISWLELAQWRLRVTHFTHRWFIVNWSITVSHTGRLQITANLANFFISALVSLEGTVPKGFIFHPFPKFDFSTPLLMKAELIRI